MKQFAELVNGIDYNQLFIVVLKHKVEENFTWKDTVSSRDLKAIVQ